MFPRTLTCPSRPHPPSQRSAATVQVREPSPSFVRSKEFCQGPYLSGRSCQGEPVRSFQRMPFTTVRLSRHRPPLLPRIHGKSGSFCSQGRSVISPRQTMVGSFRGRGLSDERYYEQGRPSDTP
jgi:hypothetical protein